MHEQLILTANKSIRELFNDRSVPMETTLEDMKELRDEIEINIQALEANINEYKQ